MIGWWKLASGSECVELHLPTENPPHDKLHLRFTPGKETYFFLENRRVWGPNVRFVQDVEKLASSLFFLSIFSTVFNAISRCGSWLNLQSSVCTALATIVYSVNLIKLLLKAGFNIPTHSVYVMYQGPKCRMFTDAS